MQQVHTPHPLGHGLVLVELGQEQEYARGLEFQGGGPVQELKRVVEGGETREQAGEGILHLLHADQRVGFDRVAVVQLAFAVPVELEGVERLVLEVGRGVDEPLAVRTLVGQVGAAEVGFAVRVRFGADLVDQERHVRVIASVAFRFIGLQ